MKNRIASLDFIRVIAISLVIIIHVSTFCFDGYILVFFKSLGTIGVPLFVLLSGYLILDRDFSGSYINKFLGRNLFPIVVSYVLWVFLWYAFSKMFGYLPIGLPSTSFLYTISEALLLNPTNNGMWYLPMLIGLYLGTPAISLILKSCSNNADISLYVKILAVLIALFGTVFPTVSTVFRICHSTAQLNPVLNFNFVSADVWGYSVWILYYLLGFILKKLKESDGLISKKSSAILSVGCTCMLFLWHILKLNSGIEFDVEYSNIFVLLSSVFVFTLLVQIDFKSHSSISKILSFISKYSFGVYMIHFWIISILVQKLILTGLFGFSVLFLCVLILSLIIVYLISKFKLASCYLLLVKK